MMRFWVFAGVLVFSSHMLVAEGAECAESDRLVVVVVRPSDSGHPPDGLGFSITMGDSTYDNAVDALRGLGEGNEGVVETVVILLDGRVPVGVLSTVILLASKSFHYSDARVFLFDHDQMAEIPDLKWGPYSDDPKVLMARLLRNAGG